MNSSQLRAYNGKIQNHHDQSICLLFNNVITILNSDTMDYICYGLHVIATTCPRIQIFGPTDIETHSLPRDQTKIRQLYGRPTSLMNLDMYIQYE